MIINLLYISRLTAIVERIAIGSIGHYIAYCRRIDGSWRIYNDLDTEVRVCHDTKNIKPHVAVYLREGEIFNSSYTPIKLLSQRISGITEEQCEKNNNEYLDTESLDIADIIPPSIETSLERSSKFANLFNINDLLQKDSIVMVVC